MYVDGKSEGPIFQIIVTSFKYTVTFLCIP